MSKSSRQARATAATAGSIAADVMLRIVDRPTDTVTQIETNESAPGRYVSPADVFTGEELAAMPLRIVNATSGRAEVWRGPDGTWYRSGAFLRIQPVKGGTGSEFKVIVLQGANRDDLRTVLRAVERLRAGDRSWRWEKRGTDWAPWADERTFSFAFHSRQYADPYTHADPSPRVEACTVPGCRDQWHEADIAVHTLDSTERDLGERGGYSITVSRTGNEPDWIVDVHTDEFYGTPDDVALLVSDLQWMQETARRANETAEPAAA